MRRERYIVYRNKMPEITGTKVECERYLKNLKKQIRSNPYYVPGWDDFYCGKISSAKSYLVSHNAFFFGRNFPSKNHYYKKEVF